MAKPNRLAVLGHPVAHSRSPAMQNAALEALGLGDGWSYEAIDVRPEDFAAEVRALPAEGFVGANVTIPHKEAALEVADEASPAATEIGAANTLSFSEGKIRAENTDAPGLLAALPERAAGKRALVLGAGGSARAAAWALARERASVEIWNRTGTRAAELAGALSATSAGEAGHLAAVSAEQARDTGYQLIVNCTAVGMDGEGDPFAELPLDPERLGEGTVLVDLVYGGEETALVAEARGRGARVVEGLEVLVSQGAESLRIWTGLEPPLAVMREAARSDREPDEDEGSEVDPDEGEVEAEELQITPTESVYVIRSEPDVLEVEAVYAAEGKAPPKHLHPDQDEHFEVLEGSLRVRVGGEEKDLGQGETLDVPARHRAPDVESRQQGGRRELGDQAGRPHAGVVRGDRPALPRGPRGTQRGARPPRLRGTADRVPGRLPPRGRPAVPRAGSAGAARPAGPRPRLSAGVGARRC